jgi:adenylate kinase
MFNLVLFGPPGSGKGTQSDKIVEEYGLVHLSTGNLLRQEIKDKTPLGLEAKAFIDKGQLVPDEVVIGMVDSYFDAHKDARGFLFDGFPRTIPQAKALDKLLELKKTAITQVLMLEVDEEELIKRLSIVVKHRAEAMMPMKMCNAKDRKCIEKKHCLLPNIIPKKKIKTDQWYGHDR